MAGVPNTGLRQDAELMAGDVIFDGRNLYDLEWITNRPFRYYSIGQPAVNPK